MTSASSRLAVAGHAGDAHDLARAHVQREAAQRRQAACRSRRSRPRPRAPPRPGSRGVPSMMLEHLAADHQPRQLGLGRPCGRQRRRRSPCRGAGPVMRSAMASTSSSLWLMKTIDSPRGGHRAQGLEQLVDLLRREHRRRLVHDQDSRAAVEHLEDLDALLLADRQLPDLAPRDRPSARTLAASSRDLRVVALAGRAGSAARSRPSRMFSVTVCDGTSVKCWWTMPRPAAMASRGEPNVDRLALDGDRRPRRAGRGRPGCSSACSCRRRSRPAGRGPRPRRRSKSTWSLARTPGKRLTMPAHLDRDVGASGVRGSAGIGVAVIGG